MSAFMVGPRTLVLCTMAMRYTHELANGSGWAVPTAPTVEDWQCVEWLSAFNANRCGERYPGDRESFQPLDPTRANESGGIVSEWLRMRGDMARLAPIERAPVLAFALQSLLYQCTEGGDYETCAQWTALDCAAYSWARHGGLPRISRLPEDTDGWHAAMRDAAQGIGYSWGG